jgi:hypothetical protein
MRRSLDFRRHAGLIAIVAVALAGATFQGGGGYEQNAHYALVRALGDGTLNVDKTRLELGQLSTGDTVRHSGHLFSNKPPMMAFVVLPAYLALDAAGVDTLHNPDRTLWVLGLFGVVLPFFVLLLLVRWVADRIEPGWGTPTAVLVGLGTSLLPFATLFWAHMLAACLLFGAFALLFRERRGAASLWPVLAAGVLVGLAFGTEIQAAETGAVLGVFALVRRPILSRGAVYTAGGALGALPFLLYTWAIWGTPFTFRWVGRADGLGLNGGGPERGRPQHVHANGLGLPSAHSAWMVLLSTRGIFVVTPIVVLGLVGLVLLIRSRFRTEGIVCASIVAVQVILDSGYYTSSISAAFGGFNITSRYLIPALPFLGVATVCALRRFPLVALGLGIVSAAIVAAATATHAAASYDGKWLQRVRAGDFSPLGWAGVPDWRAAVPFVLFIAVALVATALVLPRVEMRPRDLVVAALVLVAWAAVAVLDRSPWPMLTQARMVNGLDAFALVALVGALLLGGASLYARRARTAT